MSQEVYQYMNEYRYLGNLKLMSDMIIVFNILNLSFEAILVVEFDFIHECKTILG